MSDLREALTEPCETCGGSGDEVETVPVGHFVHRPCPSCNGRGWVPAEQAVERIKPFIHVSTVFSFATENERWQEERAKEARRAIVALVEMEDE